MRKYLKDLRKQAGLNQTQVAEKLGLSQPSIVMIENGRNKVISTDIANKLARLYGCDVRTIIEAETQYLKTRNITKSNKNKKKYAENTKNFLTNITIINIIKLRNKKEVKQMMFKNRQYAEIEKRYALTVYRAGEEVCTFYYKRQQDRDDALVSYSNSNWNPEETYGCSESYIKVWR